MVWQQAIFIEDWLTSNYKAKRLQCILGNVNNLVFRELSILYLVYVRPRRLQARFSFILSIDSTGKTGEFVSTFSLHPPNIIPGYSNQWICDYLLIFWGNNTWITWFILWISLVKCVLDWKSLWRRYEVFYICVFCCCFSLHSGHTHIYILPVIFFFNWKFLKLIILLCIQQHEKLLQSQLQNISAMWIGNGVFNQPKTNSSYTEYVMKRKCILKSNFN